MCEREKSRFTAGLVRLLPPIHDAKYGIEATKGKNKNVCLFAVFCARDRRRSTPSSFFVVARVMNGSGMPTAAVRALPFICWCV